MAARLGCPLVLAVSFGLGGCGFAVPEMNAFSPDTADSKGVFSTQGDFKNLLVQHIRCSIAKGLARVRDNKIGYASWIYAGQQSGTTVSLTLQVDEMSGVNPGLSTTNQYGNVVKALPNKLSATYPQEVLFGLGASGAAHSTRAENITYTFSNTDLLAQEDFARTHGLPNGLDCSLGMNGFQIQSNLKIDDFIWDNASLAAFGTTTTATSAQERKQNPYGILQDTLTFVASFGGSITPTWHIEQVVINPSSPFLSATRTETNTLLITIGPLKSAKPPVLTDAAQAQHAAAAAGIATAGSSKASQ